MSAAETTPTATTKKRGAWRSLGPTLITASVVIGPGTITISSKLGASQGYAMLWVIMTAGVFMWMFTTIAARVGILNRDSLLSVVARLYGRPLAVIVGLLAFTVTTAFQLSNYLACATALTSMSGINERVWIGVVGAGGLLFLAVRHLYRFAEKAMAVLVFAMVASFFANMVASRPAWGEIFLGVVPSRWLPENTGLVVAMVATTFSVIAAFYQGTLARQKGWTSQEDIGLSRREAAVGIGLLGLISCVIMITAGTVLRGQPVESAAVLAKQFEPVMGPVAMWLFSLGFLAAGFSSVVINPMVGGGLLSDGLGLGENMGAKWPRILSALGMVVGILLALVTINLGTALEGIVWAQKSTVVAVPLCAAVLAVLANDRRAVGAHRNNLIENLIVSLAVIVLVVLTVYRLMGN